MFSLNPRRRSRFAWLASTAFTWLSVSPALARTPSPRGVQRRLSLGELRQIKGAQGPLPLPGGVESDDPVTEPNAGGTYPWEGTVGDLNTVNGNKLTSIPLVAWTARGGLPVSLALYHNSEATSQSELGYHWTHSYAIYGTVSPSGDFTVQWGDNLEYTFYRNIDGSFTPPEGIFDTLTFDTGTQKYTLTQKNQLRYTFSQPNGVRWNCTTIKDRNNNTLTINHNASDFVSNIVDPSGRTLTFQYSGTTLASVTDPQGRVFSFTQTGGDLTRVSFPALSGQTPRLDLAYNSAHSITSITDLRGKVWSFGYTTNGRALAWERDPLGNQTSFTYLGGQTRITDALGRERVHTYSNGLLTSLQDPTLATVQYGYLGTLRTSITDPAGNVQQLAYDSHGNVTSIIDPLGNVVSLQYNAKNDPISIARPSGRTTLFAYDTAGNLTAVTNPLGQTAQRTVSSTGLVTATTDALGRTTSFCYDAYGNCISTTSSLAHTTAYTVDLLGRVLTATDPMGRVTTGSYDSLGRLVSVTAPGNRTASFTYDLAGNRLTQTNPLGQVESLVYDAAGRVLQHTDPLGRSVSFGYDAVGNRTRFTDGRGQSTTYSFNTNNQVSAITYPDGTSQSASYNSRGLLAQRTDGRGVQTSYSYDALGRVVGMSYSDGTPAVSFTWNSDGQKASMSDGSGTTSYAYDQAGRLVSRATPQGNLSFTYDAAGQVLTRAAAGTTTSYTYDALGRTTSTVVGGTTTATYSYDNLSRVTCTSLSNGIIEARAYRAAGDLASITTTKAGAVLTSHAYTYDALGRKLTEANPGTSVAYTYDAAGQLTSEVKTGTGAFTALYTYDAAGNRLSRTRSGVLESYTYDSANKLLTAGGKSYTYDAAGNVSAVTGLGGTTSLTWDAESRLKSATTSAGTVNYGYNGLSQRVSKSGMSNASYLLADDTIDTEVLHDGAARYDHGAMGLFAENRGGSNKFYHTDALGSVRALSDAYGTTTDTRASDAFGNNVAASGSTATPFGFAGSLGYQQDSETGLQRLGHRLYDSATGRFLSRDPIQAGYNWYTYCGNDPINFADALGLQKFQVTYTGKRPDGGNTGDLTFIGSDGSPVWSCPIGSGGHGVACPIGRFPVGRPRPSTNPVGTGGIFTPVEPVPDRDAIGIHFDGNISGTQGCIGIINWEDYIYFLGIMNGLGYPTPGKYRPSVGHIFNLAMNPSALWDEFNNFLDGLENGLQNGGNGRRPRPIVLIVKSNKK